MNVKAAQSSYRDLTDEFFSVAERRRKSLSPAKNAAPCASSSITGSEPDDRRSAVAIQSEFNKKASKIGLGIQQTSQKLAKLAQCESNYSGKAASVFDDPSAEIQELTAVIKQDITALTEAESVLNAHIQGPLFHRVRDVAPNKALDHK